MPRLLLTMLLVLWAGAAEALDLYAGEVSVAGTDETERTRAMPSAFAHVLQKLSGRRELAPSDDLDRALDEAARLAVAYYYDERTTPLPDGSSREETYLVVNFLPEAANRVLRELGLPRWRTERPPITVWVAIDDGRGRRLLPVEYDYAREAVNRVARWRGLPVAWPEVDAEQPDAGVLPLIWGGFSDQLPAVSGPSGGKVIVTARRTGPAWALRWTYDAGVETIGWNSEEMDLAFALTDGLHRLADIVAETDSIRSVAGQSWARRVTIRGLDGSEAYARCLAYLEGLSLVDSLVVESARRGQVVFALVLNADPQYLDEIIARDRVLVRAADDGSYLLLK